MIFLKGAYLAMKKFKRFCRSSGRGLTLVEVIVSVALMAILSLMIVTVMTVCFSAVKTTRTRTNNANTAANQVEAKRANQTTDTTESTFDVTFGTNTYHVAGKYVNGSDTGNNIKYKEFVPDGQ
jgi:prepilin-type N-terminal cleavage/methylation domain-containing protein